MTSAHSAEVPVEDATEEVTFHSAGEMESDPSQPNRAVPVLTEMAAPASSQATELTSPQIALPTVDIGLQG